MSVLNFIIAVIALIIAIIAYNKAGGEMKSLKEQFNTLREKTAEALDKAEKAVRPTEEDKLNQGTKK
ncbi:hypothetical protein H8E88_04250 [candidate division KSB1 bacterium]|nr:hypothetical protein [candidate division KSB1 bacterium]